MKFARIVFAVAGIWGVLILIPLYWMAGTIGRQYPPPITHADFYYGFVAVALAWQIAFLVIAKEPRRFRPLMIPAIVEKFGYCATLLVLYATGELALGQMLVGSPDLLLGALFVAAFFAAR